MSIDGRLALIRKEASYVIRILQQFKPYNKYNNDEFLRDEKDSPVFFWIHKVNKKSANGCCHLNIRNFSSGKNLTWRSALTDWIGCEEQFSYITIPLEFLEIIERNQSIYAETNDLRLMFTRYYQCRESLNAKQYLKLVPSESEEDFKPFKPPSTWKSELISQRLSLSSQLVENPRVVIKAERNFKIKTVELETSFVEMSSAQRISYYCDRKFVPAMEEELVTCRNPLLRRIGKASIEEDDLCLIKVALGTNIKKVAKTLSGELALAFWTLRRLEEFRHVFPTQMKKLEKTKALISQQVENIIKSKSLRTRLSSLQQDVKSATKEILQSIKNLENIDKEINK